MKRGPTKNTQALNALYDAKVNKRKLTLDEAILIQSSDYSRFRLTDGLLSPQELIDHEYNRLNDTKKS